MDPPYAEGGGVMSIALYVALMAIVSMTVLLIKFVREAKRGNVTTPVLLRYMRVMICLGSIALTALLIQAFD